MYARIELRLMSGTISAMSSVVNPCRARSLAISAGLILWLVPPWVLTVLLGMGLFTSSRTSDDCRIAGAGLAITAGAVVLSAANWRDRRGIGRARP